VRNLTVTVSVRTVMNGDVVEKREDDGFGPVLRGDAGGEPRQPEDAEGFGPPLRGAADTGRPEAPSLRPAADPGGADPGVGSGNGYGPAFRGRSSRTRRVVRRLATGTLVATLVLALVAVGLSAALVVTTLVSLRRQPVEGLTGGGGQMNVLVVGSDSREGLTAEELQALGTETVAGQRTDTIFVLAARGRAAAMLSLPRDLFVTRCDGSRGRINAAFATGGPSCLVDTVTRTTGIPLTHYAEVNLGGFVRIVDAVDGVSLYLDAPLRDVAAGVDLPAGCVHLDGRQAVGFVRARTVDSDLGRIARQQRFLSQLLKEVLSAETLLDVPGLFQLAHAAASALTVDDDLGVIDLARLARAARGLAGGGLATYTVPARPETIGGAAVLVPGADAVALYEQFSTGAVLDVPPAAEVAALSPGDVALSVRNGTGTPGLASAVAAELEGRGFVVTGVGNADLVDASVVRHPARLAAAAHMVAAAIPGASTTVDDSLATVELVLGPGGQVAPEAPAGSPIEPGAVAGPATSAEPAARGASSPETPLGAGAVPAGC